MDYRSPSEIRQSILEEVQSLQSSAAAVTKKTKKPSGPSSSTGSSASSSASSPTGASSSNMVLSNPTNDPLTVEREMPGIENINALNANMHLEEEVQHHIESGHLMPHEVALYIMNNGSTNQKISMFQHLHKTLKDLDDKKLSQLLAGLCDSMWVQAPELQCAAPGGLMEVLALLAPPHALEMFQGSKTMLEVSTLEVRQSWGPLVLECIKYMTPATILEAAVPLSIKKCEHSEPHDQRVFACTMMGCICRRLDADQVMKSVLTKALAMCQDTNVSVRCEMCTQLSEVARSIGLENAKARVTAELFELLSDEERLVSRAAFSCLIDLIEFFDAPYRREHFFPIIKSYISSPPEEVLSLLIEEFGRFLWKIRSDIQSADDVTLFATFFRQSAQKADAEVRRMCAFNLPAVVASLPFSAYTAHIHHCAKSLATDAHTPVRRAVAAGLHELVILLGDRAAQFLCDIFTVIAQDPSIEVRTILMKNAAAMLQTFSAQLRGEKERENFFGALVPAFVSFDQQCPKDWRKTSMLLEIFTHFPEYYNGQILYDKFIPLLWRHLKESANVIKDQCAELIMTFTASIRVTANVVDVFNKVMNDFGKSPSCYQRLNYVRLFSNACDHFSKRFLRERLLEQVLELSRDPVSSIRIAVARVSPKVRRVLKQPLTQPNEQALWDNFQNTLQRLQMDDDEFVRGAARESVELIEPIEREYNRIALMKNPPVSPEDLTDKSREDVEGNLIEAAKEHDKAERRSKLKELLKSEREKEDAQQHGRKLGPGTKRVSNVSSTMLGPSTSASMPSSKSSSSNALLPPNAIAKESPPPSQRTSLTSNTSGTMSKNGPTSSSSTSSTTSTNSVRTSLNKR